MRDWRSEAEHYIAEGDLVVEHFDAYGRRTGELLGAPADGKTLTLRGIHIFRIADYMYSPKGRLDDIGLQRQLIGG